MITPEKIEEWLREVEQRPSSAALIIQYISRRLRDLSNRNEELLAENIELRTGRRVEEYETRIANLEYQLDMLKRQIGGEVTSITPEVETISLILYTGKGNVLRTEIAVEGLTSQTVVACLDGDWAADNLLPHLLVTHAQEELLFVFDSGRTVAMPVSSIPAVSPDKLDWENAYLVEPRGGEELVVVHPIAKMSLYEYCIQTSRRGCAKRMMKASFESHLTKNFIGSGVKAQPDKTCALTFSGRNDTMVLVSREGFLFALEVGRLPYTVEEVLRLAVTDYLVSAFVPGSKPSLILITNNGKAIHREINWITPVESFKSKGQAVISPSRREAGTRIAGAAAVDETDWGMALRSDGKLAVYAMSDVMKSGSLISGSANDGVEILGFTTFRMPGTNGG